MLRRMTLVVAVVLGAGLLAAAAMQTGQQPQDRPTPQPRPAEQTFEGRIVDLYHHMTMTEETPDPADPAMRRVSGGPVGLVVRERRTMGGPQRVLYVVLVEPESAEPGTQPRDPMRDPDDDDDEPWGGPQDRGMDRERMRDRDAIHRDDKAKSNVIYDRARMMTGEDVRVIGYQIERDNVRAIVVTNIIRQDGRPVEWDREQDRRPERPDRDRPRRPER